MTIKYLPVKNINKKIDLDVKKLILDAESKFRSQLFTLANKILNSKTLDMVCIAGPSCAGKTTTCRLLKEVFEFYNRDVITFSMDDFYMDLNNRTLLENGKPDLESLNALRLDLVDKCFKSFFEGKETYFPIYDFKTAHSIEKSRLLKKKNNTIVIFEGLHTLNPELLMHVGTKYVYRIYVSPITSFENNNCRMTTKDLRLLRRTIRDIEQRNYTASQTLEAWPSVTDAEVKYIEPYRDTADYTVNTTHEYELGIFKFEIQKYLNEGKIKESEIPFKDIINEIKIIDKELLPETTLMWEFVSKNKKTITTEKEEHHNKK